ncbi:MAG: hypothetical protein R6U68_00320 [Desulfobacteraceae bacterium]
MEKKFSLGLMLIVFLLLTEFVQADSNYMSSYEKIQWGMRGEDTFYCIDICDENWNIYDGFQALECRENFYSWFPKQFVNNLGIPDEAMKGFVFHWRVWSSSGYGGEGFEGRVVVGGEICNNAEYISTSDLIQWGCRNSDTFYCIDIFDGEWNMLYQAISCGEGLHSYSPQELDLRSGTYHWKVWSPSGYGGEGFDGQINISTADTDVSAIVGNWRVTVTVDARGCDEGMYTYTHVMAVNQNGNGFSITGQDGDGDAYVLRGSINNNIATVSGEYSDDVGTTSVNASLKMTGNTFNGTAFWTWTNGYFYCSGSDEMEGSKL